VNRTQLLALMTAALYPHMAEMLYPNALEWSEEIEQKSLDRAMGVALKIVSQVSRVANAEGG